MVPTNRLLRPLDPSHIIPATRPSHDDGDGHGHPHTSLDTSARSVKRHLIELLRAAGDRIRAAAVARCGAEFHALRCANGHLHRAVPTERCRYRLCPDCARWRRRRAFARAWPAIRACHRRHPRDRWVLVTLTVRASQDPLPHIVRRLKRALARLRRARDWQRCIRGGVVSVEMTYQAERGWHVHAHLLASRRAWWPQAELAARWQRVTGGEGQVVDIRPVAGLRAGLAAVLHYVFKPANLLTWGPEQIRQFNALGRAKLSECYGELRGLAAAWEADEGSNVEPAATPLMEGDPCPRCGARLVAERVRWHVVVDAWNSS
jgi:Replication protein